MHVVSVMVAIPIPHENETLLHQQAWEGGAKMAQS